MEALLEKEGQVENWNDDRLDELSRRVDAGFAEMTTKTELTAVKNEMDLRFDHVDQRFGEVDKRFDKIDHQLARINDRLDKLTYAILGILGTFAAATVAAVFGSAVL